MQASDIKPLLGKPLQVRAVSSGAKYCGVLAGIRDKTGKFCLTKLVILNQDGTFKAAPKTYSRRWFSLDKFEVCTDPVKFLG